MELDIVLTAKQIFQAALNEVGIEPVFIGNPSPTGDLFFFEMPPFGQAKMYWRASMLSAAGTKAFSVCCFKHWNSPNSLVNDCLATQLFEEDCGVD